MNTLLTGPGNYAGFAFNLKSVLCKGSSCTRRSAGCICSTALPRRRPVRVLADPNWRVPQHYHLQFKAYFCGRTFGSGLQLPPCRSIPRAGPAVAPTDSRRTRLLRATVASMGEPQTSSESPENFRYIQLWVSEDGESHIKECKMTGFKSQAYSSLPQFVKDEFGGEPEKMTFTELSVGLEQPLHTAPQVQFVVTLSGSWYIKTTDGAKHVFKPGEVLFQDNTKKSPAHKLGEHFSGVVGDVPCQQFIVQFNRTPQVDNPNTF